MNEQNERTRLIWGLIANCDMAIGSGALRKLRQYLQNLNLRAEDFWQNPREIGSHCKWSDKQIQLIELARERENEESLVKKLEAQQIKIGLIDDQDYPRLWRYIPDYPPVIFYQGDLQALATPALAIVGSRKMSCYSKLVIEQLLNARMAKLTIVSGLMRGVDQLAHEQALKIGAKTVAILGYGLDLTWPREMEHIRAEILNQGGLVVSEFPLQAAPRKETFPIRNRLVASASLGTLVIEAAEESGSLITANLALDYGREVMAVPGSIFNPTSRGCHQLIANGAALVQSSEEIIETLLSSRVGFLPDDYYQVLEGDNQAVQAKLKNKEFIDPWQTKVYQLLELKPKLSLEEISQELKQEVSIMMSTVTLLELAGEIEQLEGHKYQIKL